MCGLYGKELIPFLVDGALVTVDEKRLQGKVETITLVDVGGDVETGNTYPSRDGQHIQR